MINLYTIRALTDMHVGGGDANYNIVENQVQRDVITKFPTINGSSLKGALKHHFDDKEYEGVFGSEKAPGSYKFFSGKLLSYPVRSNKRPFYRATCPMIIKELIDWLETFNLVLKDQPQDFLKNFCGDLAGFKNPFTFDNQKVIIEDYIIKAESGKGFSKYQKGLEDLFGENLAIFPDKEFQELMKNLPVIPRNQLENGISRNLWYEEIVPRETRFYFMTMVKEGRDPDFDKKILEEVIQIGGNATIGYGYTKFGKIEVVEKDGGKNV